MHFERRGLLLTAAAAATACLGCSSIAVDDLIRQPSPSFGGPVELGTVAEVIGKIRANDGFWYVPEGQAWVTEYPDGSLERARAHYSDDELVAMRAGFVVLFQKCPHLGCRVPQCLSSELFECPCHGSKYNQVGEKLGGPAPRGMDRFAVIIDNDRVAIDPTRIIPGPADGVDTVDQEPAGPLCVELPAPTP